MARSDITLQKTNSIFDELTQMHEQVARRAYDPFLGRGLESSPLRDWLDAERELFRQPPVELRQRDGQFEIVAALAGVEPKDLDVKVTPDDVLIHADLHERSAQNTGKVHVSDFVNGEIVRSLHFPEPIDPDSVKADFRDGLLHLTANLAKAQKPRSVEVRSM